MIVTLEDGVAGGSFSNGRRDHIVTLILGSVSVLATYLPASRATRVDPLPALRWE